MSRAFTNPKSSNPPENNYPPKVETSKLISLFAKKKIDMIIRYPEQIKCHTDPSFIKNGYLTLLFITLNVQDIHLPFLKCPCGVHILAI